MNIHRLSTRNANKLIEELTKLELDDFMPIGELIGIAFDENSAWGQMSVAELRCLLHLSLGQLEEAKENSNLLVHFNEYLPERRQFFHAVDTIVEIALGADSNIDNYEKNLILFFGPEIYKAAKESVLGKRKFYGIPESDSKLKGFDKHLKLIESFRKLHKKRNT